MQHSTSSGCQKKENMRVLTIGLVLISLFVSSCNKSSSDDSHYIKATVVQTNDISCYRPVLNFSEDSLQVRSVTGVNDFVYIVKGLPASFNIQGKELYVSVALLTPEEDFACTTYGISHPHLKITAAKERQ